MNQTSPEERVRIVAKYDLVCVCACMQGVRVTWEMYVEHLYVQSSQIHTLVIQFPACQTFQECFVFYGQRLGSLPSGIQDKQPVAGRGSCSVRV